MCLSGDKFGWSWPRNVHAICQVSFVVMGLSSDMALWSWVCQVIWLCGHGFVK